jgi:hypothetical protein
VAAHAEQGWSLLCNGVVLFEDTGELLPDGQVVQPHRPATRSALPARRDPRAAVGTTAAGPASLTTRTAVGAAAAA